ncbi:UDP-N-acetylmuramate:L-alanyl-gamma-D-glutamyl-me so-diaminopimelate ligase [Desulfolithobacter dissulfuricans]|uniref:UDP-N-acetylmuramate:L-alanyl-gamma-D-glutamyl-me so-diaminopimelate ligase n=1 Tax=Desulfolithobacter dissulfuricans TaxID=2795293 RepID=A0A915TYP9_9BACT|nr:UDP-N-acetylmuramate:L-alanyl-gamma-D-glutamyl-meso-diaminopimelate ligase [Desulfolithobacter dissulfuricans]BCO08251.1 UDP-N-acetylmuramate:L-alanyl-gamma-D-glutamyl-me so-diaminopimelate ligase [Desulfolithobacter dissulfuricans]
MKEARLDPALNHVPDHVEHIHIMGICGTGMAALAGMLQERGFRVTGSDQNVYPPMSDFLAARAIPVMEGYGRENLEVRPDLVVVGNVIRAVFEEALALAELGIPYVSMPQALGHFFLGHATPLVVAGTHGKTTTSSLLATTLFRAGAAPGFMIGGIVEAFGSNYHLGEGEYFVVEGDEYDTAFFDKGSKFLHYRPRGAILTSIEFDHADIFADLAAIKSSFVRFVSLIPEDGVLVAHGDDPVVLEIAGQCRGTVLTYGFGPDNDWQVERFRADGLSSHFRLARQGQGTDYVLPMPGRHNVLNATAVAALMDHLGFGTQEIRSGLASFEGVRRRQQIRGEVDGITVLDDFAHHPTAVRETVDALARAWPDRRLVVVFEPRTNSSRRSVFQEAYATSFTPADLVFVREHIPLQGVPVDEQFSSARLVQDLCRQGLRARCFPDTGAIIEALVRDCRSGDVVAILSNGGFDGIHQRLLRALREDRG